MRVSYVQARYNRKFFLRKGNVELPMPWIGRFRDLTFDIGESRLHEFERMMAEKQKEYTPTE